MNKNIQRKPQPTPETPEKPEPIPEEEVQTSDQPASSKEKEKAEKKPPSRFQLFLRKVLIGLAIVAVIFLAGFLTDHFIRYRPLSETLAETQTELEQVNLALSNLEDENERLKAANQIATDEITALEAELSAARANALFYQVLVDVNTARNELFLENVEGAQTALLETQDNLEDLLPFIIEVDPELGLSLPRRLDLIISGLARDPETGLIDLELFTKDLLELEPLLISD